MQRETGSGTPWAGTRTQLLSDVHGRIAHVCLALPTYQSETVPRLLECVGAVLRALGPAVRSSILVHAGDERLLRDLAPRHRLEPVPWTRPRTIQIGAGDYRIEHGVLRLGALPWGDFTPWVQDSFLVARRGGGACLLASPHVARPGGGADEDVPHTLARHLGWPCETLPIPFAAANVLVDGGHVVLGRSVGAGLPARSATRTLRSLFAPAGRRAALGLLRVPARSRQPSAHQDLYLTLAGPHRDTGRPVALVGSTRLAAQLLGQRHTPGAVSHGLEHAARTMAAAGYDVVRLPYATTRLPAARKDSVITYNNALIEVWPDSAGRLARRVILARFGTDGGADMTSLDAAAAAIWRGLGFDVCFADGPFTWLGLFDGGVHCLTKVLARTEPATAARRSGAAS